MQYFYIKQGSTLNTLRVELVKDGRYDFMKASHFDNALQNADITFTMVDENGNLKVSNAECVLGKVEAGSCDEHYAIEYHWKTHGKEALRFRNEEMLSDCDAIISFDDGIKDTKMIAKMAIDKGLPHRFILSR